LSVPEISPRGPAEIRIRACLAVVHGGRILLVPHYNTDAGPIQWVIPGGRVTLGEKLGEAACREFREETGLDASVTGLLDVSEVILPEKDWHSVTVVFSGTIVGGRLAPEAGHRFGEKMPRWFSLAELQELPYHPRRGVERALAATQTPANPPAPPPTSPRTSALSPPGNTPPR
jgi:8-oxo-dGTP diphosphatase